ncbi:hypothetical protein MVEN_00162900 [Mycena venus]|uniref:Uncharacterized protein n=1 Tax=Mycena venus TaxID=2733690 RepID=A0A8H6Z329_9AGAR|nr:hypothetical protein MVEN_00162900 [Mycena venus]
MGSRYSLAFPTRNMLRFLGLDNTPRVASTPTRYLRSTPSAGDASYLRPGCTSLPSSTPSPTTSSPATSSPSSSSPYASSPDTSPSLSSPGQSFCTARELVLGGSDNLDQSGNQSPVLSNFGRFDPRTHDSQRLPPIEPRSSHERGLPPSYETAMSTVGAPRPHSTSPASPSGEVTLHASTIDLQEGTSQPRTSQRNIQLPAKAPRPLPSPLRSPTIRVTSAPEGTEVTSISERAPQLAFDDSTASYTSPIRRPRLLQLPAGARGPYATPRMEMELLYAHTFHYLKAIASSTNQHRTLTDLDEFRGTTRNLGTVEYLVCATRHRDTLFKASMNLGVADDPRFQAALEEDQTALTDRLLEVLYSPSGQQAILALEDDAAQSVLDFMQYVRIQLSAQAR